MSDYEYKGSGTPGGFWGCLIGALVGAPLLAISLLISAMGDCVPKEPCKHGLTWKLFVPSVLIAASVGFSIRFAINWFVRGRNDGD